MIFKNQLSMRTVHQRGLTLVELMIAMTLSLLIAMAAAAALAVARQGFSSIDASSQVRDNARFAQDILQRIVGQAGFISSIHLNTSPAPTETTPSPIPPHVFGFNNSSRTSTHAWSQSSGTGTFGSDILILRYQPNTPPNSNNSDQTMIDCLGKAATYKAENNFDRVASIFHVSLDSSNEPSLMCSSSDTGDAPFDTQPLIQGVETFQVLYGVNGIKPNNTANPSPPTESSIPSSVNDSVVDRYLRADQLTVSGNEAATYANWTRVRSIRIGMILRAKPGSAAERNTQILFPLGNTRSSASGEIGSAFSSTDDASSAFNAPADGRLRQAVTFTLHLRNHQENLK